MSKKVEKSAVVKMYNCFCSNVWRRSSGMNYTREKDSQTDDEFWFLLIKSGFCFEKTDLVDLGVFCDESHYSLAVRNGNLSFAYAYEHRHGRIPFIGTGLCYRSCWPRFPNHATQAKSSGRLCMGVKFSWYNKEVKVTSFNDKKKTLVACSYRPKKKGEYGDKIEKRFTITAEQFRKEMSERKKGQGVWDANIELEEKGVKVFYQENFGYFVSKLLKTKTNNYDATGKVGRGGKPKDYKPFTSIKAAVEFAKTLVK